MNKKNSFQVLLNFSRGDGEKLTRYITNIFKVMITE